MKTYREIFESNSEEKLISAVKNGMNVYLRRYSNYDYETFFEAAVKYGTPALVNACIDMGADVNCISPVKARYSDPRAVTSSLFAAIRANNAAVLRALLERGARLGVLNNVEWDTQINLIPEAAYDKEAAKIKQRLDTGTEILKVLRDFGFKVPGSGDDCEKISLYGTRVGGSYNYGSEYADTEETAGEKYTAWDNWDGEYADGYIDNTREAYPYCEWSAYYLHPHHGTRPGALWRAASPGALRFMLALGADANARGGEGWTALHHIAYHAASRRRADYYFNPTAMMQVLLDNGADIEARSVDGLTPLMAAAGNYDSCDWDVSAFNFLLRNGADFRAKDNRGRGVWYCITRYWCGRDAELDEFIHQRVLLELYRSGRKETVKNEPEEICRFPLMPNKWGGVGEAVSFLIANGINVNLMRLEKAKENRLRLDKDLRKFGLNPARLFADVFTENSAEAIASAVKNGLDLSAENKDEHGENFIEAALRHGAPNVIQACVDRGIAKNGLGCMLRAAAEACNAGAVEILLKAGADPAALGGIRWRERENIFPEADYSPESMAFKRRLIGGAKILNILREAGAIVPNSGCAPTYLNIEGRGRVLAEMTHIKEKRHEESGGAVVERLRRAASPKALKLLTDAGLDVNARDHEGNTAMHWLAYECDAYFYFASMIKILIEAGADVNVRNNTGRTPLMVLAWKSADCPRALEAVQYLSKAGAYFSAKDKYEQFMYNCLEAGYSNFFWEYLLRRALFDAIHKTFGKRKRALSKKKANADLFMYACWGSAPEIEWALSRGANVNARIGYGYTPLMYAAAFNTKEAVQCLAANGADVDAKTGGDRKNTRRMANGTTALMLASKRSDCKGIHRVDVILALTEAGAGVNTMDNNGETALRHAMNQYHLDAANALLASGADMNGFFTRKINDKPEDKNKDDNDYDVYSLNDGEEIAKNKKIKACLRQFDLKA